MNRDEAIQRAEVAMAWAKGEAEVQTNVGNDEWKTINPPETVKQQQFWAGPPFFDDATQWRIKPKPLECWVWVSDEQRDFGPSVTFSSSISFRDDQPRTPPASRCMPGRWVRMREVE